MVKPSFEEARKLLVEDRKDLPNNHINNPTAFGIVYGTKNPSYKCYDYVCLGSLMTGYKPGPNGSFYIFHQAKGSPFARAWLQWLLGKDSPWRDLVKAQPEQDFDWVFDNGYVLSELDFPGNYVGNFLTAFRMPYEKPKLFKFWHDLVKDGVSPGAALVTTAFVNHGNDGWSKGLTPLCTFLHGQGHHPVSSQSSDLKIAARLNEAVLVKKSLKDTPFEKSTRYNPCNIIWSGVGEETVDTPMSRAFWKFLSMNGTFDKAPVTSFKRSFAAPNEYDKDNDYHSQWNRPSKAPYETLVKFGRWLDSLQFSNLDTDMKLTWENVRCG